MFGLLRPASAIAARPALGARRRAYRRSYARLCRLQRGRFGVRTAPLLSYEAAFLFRLLAEAGACPPPPATAPACCRLRFSPADAAAPDAAAAAFCGAFGLALAAVKLEDDVRDERSLPARLARRALRRPIRAAFAELRRFDADYERRARGWVDRHLALERPGRLMPLGEYVAPTAEAFGHSFALAAALLPSGSARTTAAGRLGAIGRAVGTAIVARDCGVDWRRDRRRGRFNPLSDAAAARAAATAADAALARAGWEVADWLGEGSAAAGLLRDRLARPARVRAEPPEPTPWRGRLERWGLLAQPGYVYVGFDCVPCDGCGGCGDGCEGCGEVPGAAACCCPVDCCCDEARLCCESREEKRSGSASDAAGVGLVGLTGRTLTPLRPSGVVELAGERRPARSRGDFIEAGVPVVVTAAGAYGVEVRATGGAG